VVSVTTSVGISRFPDDGEDFGRLLHTADSRMYKHKRPHPR
jgi:GGDEF domain-containing protein